MCSSDLVDDHCVRPGDRVAIAMRNFPEWSLAFFAAASIGAVVVPLNAWWTGPELEYGLADSGSVVLFCDAERAERLRDHLPDLPAVRSTIVAKPEAGNEYTWWSNRGAARANNVGWRIDYQIITPSLRERVRACTITPSPRFSDHAPMLVEYA